MRSFEFVTSTALRTPTTPTTITAASAEAAGERILKLPGSMFPLGFGLELLHTRAIVVR